MSIYWQMTNSPAAWAAQQRQPPLRVSQNSKIITTPAVP